jgi:ABC-type transport system substrate-binding protein
MFQQDAKKAGVHVDLKRIEEMSTVWKTLKEGKFDAVAQTGGLTPEVMAASWHSKADYGFYGFGDKEVDKKLDQLNKQSDPEKRAKIHKELIQIVLSHLPTLPGLYSSHVHYLISPKISVDPRFPAQAWRWKLAVSN